MKRKAMTVKRLARWISAEVVPDEDGEHFLELDREWAFDQSRGLSARTAGELETLHGRLCRAIPDDFDFSLCFEAGNVIGGLEYSDGPHSGYHMPMPVPLDRNFLNALRELDWESLRTHTIQMTQLHENAADYSENIPSTLESIKATQERHAAAVEGFRDDPEFSECIYAMVFANDWLDEDDEEEFVTVGYEVGTYPDRDRLLGEMGDLLACCYSIIAIRESGRLLTSEETEILRQVALDGLGPISRAKAEGRFEAAMAMMMPNQF